jgi:sugar-specific transcriptional regulator TrmB
MAAKETEKVVEALVKLGFKEYQARVYCALVALGQGSGAQVHKMSGVPRPRVYDTLDELVKIGAVNFHRGRPTVYQAVDPAAVVEWSRKSFLKAGDEVIRCLEKLSIGSVEPSFEPIWLLRGDDNIQSKMKMMIDQARKEIFVRFFGPERYLQVGSQLNAAKRRRVHVKSILASDEKALLAGVGDLAQDIDFRLLNSTRIAATKSDPIGVMSTVMEIMPIDSASGLSEIGLIISDGDQSIFVLGDRAGGNRYAVWIGLPLIVRIQRAVFEYMWQISDMIETARIDTITQVTKKP